MGSNKEIIRFEDGRYVGDVQGDISTVGANSQNGVEGFQEGNFHLNKMQGRGNFTYKNGDVYTGNWNNDERSGFGKIDYNEGGSYAGPMEREMGPEHITLKTETGTWVPGT